MKQESFSTARGRYSRLEIKRTSITRLKQMRMKNIIFVSTHLEIKRTSITRLKQEEKVEKKQIKWLEIKRTSITRLKLQGPIAAARSGLWMLCLKSKEPRLRDWNFRVFYQVLIDFDELEIKRTSITRLKLGDWQCHWCSSRLTWNQKNLDYEIET